MPKASDSDQQAARDHHRQHERHPGQQVLVHPALSSLATTALAAPALDLPFRQRPLERRAGLLEGHAGAATVDLLAGETGRVHVDVGGQQDHVGGGDVRRVERVARADRALGLDLQREAQLPRRELQRLGGHEGAPRRSDRRSPRRSAVPPGLRRNQAGLVPGDLHARQGGGPLEEGARIGQRLGGTRAIHRLADETRRRQRLDADQQDPVGFGDLFGAQFALGPRPGIRLDAGFPAQALGGALAAARAASTLVTCPPGQAVTIAVSSQASSTNGCTTTPASIRARRCGSPMPNSNCRQAGDGGGLTQHPLGRPAAGQPVQHAGQQGIAGAHRAGHFHAGGCAQAPSAANQLTPAAPWKSHLAYPVLAQTFGRLRDQVIHRRRAEIGQFLEVRLDHPRRSLHTFAGRAAAVEGDLQAEAPQAPQQFAQPFRLDPRGRLPATTTASFSPGKPSNAAWARSSASGPGLWRSLTRPPRSASLMLLGFRPAPDERIGEATTLEHGGERRLVVFAEEAADRQPMAEVGKHLGDVQTLAGGLGQHRLAG